MKRLWLVLVCVAIVCVATPAYAAAPGTPAELPVGFKLPLFAFEDEEWTVPLNSQCYGSGAWAGFTYGIVKNAPKFNIMGYTVTNPAGEVVLDVTLEDSADCWTNKLWDPVTCVDIGVLTPFNEHLGVKPYFMAWFTPVFEANMDGTWMVHTTMVQTRPAPDLILVEYEENGELITLKHPMVWMPFYGEVDWEFTVK